MSPFLFEILFIILFYSLAKSIEIENVKYISLAFKAYVIKYVVGKKRKK